MTAEGWSLLVAGVLVVLAAFLVAGETAFGRVSVARVEELQREGVRGAARLRELLVDRARYVNVLLFLHTLLFVSATVLVTRAFLELVPGEIWWRLVAAALVMVVLGFVALGVAPRTLGVQHADRIALRTAGFARAIAVLLGPITSLLILVGNAITPGRGFKRGPFASQAELRELVDLAGASDLIEDDERQMIHSVFELGDTVARELMVPRTEIVFIESTKTLRQAMSLGLRSGFSRIPVIGESADDIVGVIYLKDVVKRTFESRDAENTERVESLMRDPYFVPDSKRADDLLRDMQSARVHMAIVIDEYGGTAGIVTIEDLVEELIGEIVDEFDHEDPMVQRLPGGGLRVQARMSIDEVSSLVGENLPEGDWDTIGGLMFHLLGHVPFEGESVTEGSFRLRAEQVKGRRIGMVKIERLPE